MNNRMHKPPHPGEVLLGLYLQPLELSIQEFAKRIRVSRNTVSKIVNGHRGVTPDMALRFSRALGGTPDSWLGMQAEYDLWQEEKNNKEWKKIKRIEGNEAA